MRKSKHDKIIDEIVNRLYNSQVDYDLIEQQREYDMNNGKHGECDIYAVHKHDLLLFEIKSRNAKKHRLKAYHQLEKDSLYFNRLFKPHRIFKFYVYGEGNHYKIERVNLKL